MGEENDVTLNKQTEDLLNQVNHYFPGKVEVQFIGHLKAGYVRHDQAQTIQDHNNLFIQTDDLTEPDFTVSHELLHLLMTLRGFPQIYFPLTTEDDALDEQLMYMGTELFDTICHFVVYSEQRKHGLIDKKVEEEFTKGIRHTITPEAGKVDNEMPLRLVTLLDTLVFLSGKLGSAKELLETNFPISLAAAQKLYVMLTQKKIDSPFAVRRTVVKLYREFDNQMKAWELPSLQLNDFVMISGVFSERQLNLQVKQVFKLYHSGLKEKKTGKRAYVGFTKSDDQNTLVTDGPVGNKASEAYFQNLYSKTVKELFQELHIPYLIR